MPQFFLLDTDSPFYVSTYKLLACDFFTTVYSEGQFSCCSKPFLDAHFLGVFSNCLGLNNTNNCCFNNVACFFSYNTFYNCKHIYFVKMKFKCLLATTVVFCCVLLSSMSLSSILPFETADLCCRRLLVFFC